MNNYRRKRVQTKKHYHPGKIVQEIMQQRSLSLERLKPSIKIDIQEFELFLNEKKSVDDDLSRELSRLFGKTAREWMKMQKEYDFAAELAQAQQEAKAAG